MPLYTQKSLVLEGRRGILSPGIGQDDGQEDFANSEHSGRWGAGLYTIRYCTTLGDEGLPTTGTQNVDFITPNADNWEFLVIDAVIESRITAFSGTYRINLGNALTGLRNNIVVGAWHGVSLTPVVHMDEANASLYDPDFTGKGGQIVDSVALGFRWEASSLTSVVPSSRIVVTIIGYLIPEPYVAGS